VYGIPAHPVRLVRNVGEATGRSLADTHNEREGTDAINASRYHEKARKKALLADVRY
jgi:hypothetical protein